MLVSSDQGAHFTAHPLGFRVGGNEDGRNVGERLQVDPNKGSILFYGTANSASQSGTNGVWTSTDSGSSWTRVNGFNALSSDGSGAGVAFVAFYKPTGKERLAHQDAVRRRVNRPRPRLDALPEHRRRRELGAGRPAGRPG